MLHTMSRIMGINLSLRLIQPEDAAYLHSLRTDPNYNSYLSSVTGTVEDQRKWIEMYKGREIDGTEYYYIIERNDGMRCGVVRLYKITPEKFTWGSWILDRNKPPKAALESAILSFEAGFNILNIDIADIDVRVGNTRAEAFYRRLGMTEVHRDKQNIYFVYTREQFNIDQQAHMQVLKTEKNDRNQPIVDW